MNLKAIYERMCLLAAPQLAQSGKESYTDAGDMGLLLRFWKGKEMEKEVFVPGTPTDREPGGYSPGASQTQ